MAISGFERDDDNIFHIERHQFTPVEVEEVFAGDHKVRRTREKRYMALGEMLDGRLAFVVFRRLSGGLVRVIAARDMDASERRLFRRKWVEQMKKKLSPAKSPLPKFQSDQEAVEYFENHSVASVWDQLSEALGPNRCPQSPRRKPSSSSLRLSVFARSAFFLHAFLAPRRVLSHGIIRICAFISQPAC